ncbi:hypothetical protein DRO27_05045 [Candidatus Bathyarchaeota archaeon]|nr:MAG: hypothetical protein DRO27_05045 [Candidatus Bathyarchaeota archaeon]
MVTIVDIWIWLGVNSNTITSIVGIVAIALAVFVAWKSPKWQYEAEYKKDIIKEVFPELTRDFRRTSDNYYRFLEGKIARYSKFAVLFELDDTGKIKQVKKIDETLYDNLLKIRYELYPLMFDLQNERDLLYSDLKARWEAKINTFGGIHLSADRFARELYSEANFHIWREEYEAFLDDCHTVLKNMTGQSGQVQPPTDEQLMELQRIAEAEMTRIKVNVGSINEKIDEIIYGVVIPRLEDIIADPF